MLRPFRSAFPAAAAAAGTMRHCIRARRRAILVFRYFWLTQPSPSCVGAARCLADGSAARPPGSMIAGWAGRRAGGGAGQAKRRMAAHSPAARGYSALSLESTVVSRGTRGWDSHPWASHWRLPGSSKSREPPFARHDASGGLRTENRGRGSSRSSCGNQAQQRRPTLVEVRSEASCERSLALSSRISPCCGKPGDRCGDVDGRRRGPGCCGR